MSRGWKIAGAALIVTAIVFAYGLGRRQGRENTAAGPAHEHDVQTAPNDQGEIEYWTCTMHPSVRMRDPGKCPICAMDLVPVRRRSAAPAAHEHEMQPPMAGQPAASADEPSIFHVDPLRQQTIGVRTETVGARTLKRTISTIGRVELDERRIVQVHTKYSGWIGKVFADFTWQHVEKGEPLFAIYSPELVATQEEYLLAMKAKATLGGHALREVSGGAESLLEAARRRLQLWDVTEEQIERLEQTGEVQKDLIVYSPAAGHVTERNAFENMRVEPGSRLYTIADHSVVWVFAEVYENDAPLVRLGQRASIALEAAPGRVFTGRVAFIEPHVMETTRTLRARLEVPNPDLILKPGMYAQVELQSPPVTVLSVPESAVLRTGERDIVFIDHGEGRMEVRRVQIGRSGDGAYEVVKGLQAGERVVVAGNFLIDAESRVQGAIASWQQEPRP